MKEKSFETHLKIFDGSSELPSTAAELLKQAENAREKAYAPYSEFFVGAALRLENGEIFTGNNQENAAYPSGLCAERVALFYAKSNFPDLAIEEICVVTSSTHENPTPPCGSCRQVLMEYELQQERGIPVYFAAKSTIYQVGSVAELLPFAFNKKFLEP
jgi:cytidine deaminase